MQELYRKGSYFSLRFNLCKNSLEAGPGNQCVNPQELCVVSITQCEYTEMKIKKNKRKKITRENQNTTEEGKDLVL